MGVFRISYDGSESADVPYIKPLPRIFLEGDSRFLVSARRIESNFSTHGLKDQTNGKEEK